MDEVFRLVGPNRAVELFGVKLVGANRENAAKLLFTLALVVLLFSAGRLLQAVVGRLLQRRAELRTVFWARQAIRLGTVLLLLVGLVSVWFDDPTRLTTALGLVTAGLAFALQKVVSALAGYFVILRGKNFNLGDRITMGGVRGDVIALDFIQTTIMEMGQPPPVQGAEPAMWVQSRQYTGRVVTVSNAKIFDEPVFNYTRDFPYIWEELSVPIKYRSDRDRAEQILLEATRRLTVDVAALSNVALAEMQRRYFVKASELAPRVYYRLTDNWLELTVRFIVEDHGVREVKDRLSREVLRAFDQAEISIASATVELAGLPPLRLERSPR
ncbi:MAG: mechanosensitive ion channel family protein [Myxococcota bacterium]|nr:mechanosensitive ion channel family protein [Myxococcota bacterium]